MSLAAMTWAKRQRVGSAPEKLVLLVLADYATAGPPDGDDRPSPAEAAGRHYAWAGIGRVAEDCEMSERSVRRHEEKLLEKGLIRKVRRTDRAGHRRSDFIVLAVDDDGSRPFPGDSQTPSGQADLKAISGLEANSGLEAGTGLQPCGKPGPGHDHLAVNCGLYKENHQSSNEDSLRSSSGDSAPTLLDLPAQPQPEADPADVAPTSQTLLGEHIDALVRRPAKQVIGHLAKSIKDLLEQDFAADHIRAGLKRMRDRQLNPSTLPSLVTDAANAATVPIVPPTRRTARNIGDVPTWEM